MLYITPYCSRSVRTLSPTFFPCHSLGELAQGATTTAEQVESQVHALDLWRSEMLGFFKDYDVIVCPVCASPAVLHGEAAATAAFPMFSYTFTYNLTGWPGAVVRAGTSAEGLSIGVQIVARPGREDVALAVAKFVETAHGGYQRPTLCGGGVALPRRGIAQKPSHQPGH